MNRLKLFKKPLRGYSDIPHMCCSRLFLKNSINLACAIWFFFFGAKKVCWPDSSPISSHCWEPCINHVKFFHILPFAFSTSFISSFSFTYILSWICSCENNPQLCRRWAKLLGEFVSGNNNLLMIVGSMPRPKYYLGEAGGGGESGNSPGFPFSKAKRATWWNLAKLLFCTFGKPKLYGLVKTKVEGE